MTQRVVGGQTYNLGYDAENHMVSVSGAAAAAYTYTGDGQRIVATEGVTTTVYLSNYLEWAKNGETITTKSYYYAGTTRVAMRQDGGAPLWLFGDHLGSTNVVANYDGSAHGKQGYQAWGETRFVSGDIPTSFQYTGQRNEANIGLYYYGARWYDSSLGRFAQADTIVPGKHNLMAFDRYAYAQNNPSRFSDPSGHKVCDNGEQNSDCDGGGGWTDVPLGDRLYMYERWDLFEKHYHLNIDDLLSEAAKLAIYAAVYVVSHALANATSADDTPVEIFIMIFGSLWFEQADVTYWGYAAAYNHIQLDPTVNWNNPYIVHFLIHEMGHAFAQSIRDRFAGWEDGPNTPYNQLASKYANDPDFPIRPEGFADGAGWMWSRESGREGHSDEFADMFLGWVYGAWALDTDGATRASWMDGGMHTWLGWVYGVY